MLVAGIEGELETRDDDHLEVAGVLQLLMGKLEALNLKKENFKAMQSFIVEPPKLEQKPLPAHMKYAYLRLNRYLSMFISSRLSTKHEYLLLQVLVKERFWMDKC